MVQKWTSWNESSKTFGTFGKTEEIVWSFSIYRGNRMKFQYMWVRKQYTNVLFPVKKSTFMVRFNIPYINNNYIPPKRVKTKQKRNE